MYVKVHANVHRLLLVLQPSGTYQVCMRPREPAAVRPGQDRWQLVNVTVNDSQCGGEGKKCCPFGLANKDSFPFEPVESSGEPRG